MLEEVLRYINNRFDRGEALVGKHEISDGAIDLGGAVLEGQYFWIEGSVLNDGLHLYPPTDLQDETFRGKIVPLFIPRAVVGIADEVTEWLARNADAIGGPYQSESFGGYSYTIAGGNASGNEAPASAWQAHFGARLRPYRKIRRDWV